MDWEILRASLDLALNSPQKGIDLAFQGGEPLLEFPMIRRAIEYLDENRPPDKRLRYSIGTNGTLLTREITAFLAKHSFNTKLSFDGVADAQNYRGKGTFPILDRLLDRLRLEHPDFYQRNLTINLIVIPPTIHLLAESFDYFLEKGVQKILIAPSITPYPGWRDECIDELDTQFARIYESSLRHFRLKGEIPLLLFGHRGNSTFGGKGSLPMCGLVHGEKLTLGMDGTVCGCVLLANSYQDFSSRFLRGQLDALKMGKISDPGLPRRHARFLDAVRQAEIFHNKEKKYTSYGRCGDCKYIYQCSMCPISIAHVPGNNDPNRVPDFYCAYNKVSLKYRDRFPSRPNLHDFISGKASIFDEMKRWKALAESIKENRLAESSFKAPRISR